uniref:Uncharacterized protein n=1 Tax=Polynucleobacter necessarius subsp. necessarius (strain STIR1) TaxID=452638 RepID=B1XUR0_POLNS
MGSAFHSPEFTSLRIIIAALLLSIVGHLILFFGLPFVSFNDVHSIPEDLIIRTELKTEPPKKKSK